MDPPSKQKSRAPSPESVTFLIGGALKQVCRRRALGKRVVALGDPPTDPIKNGVHVLQGLAALKRTRLGKRESIWPRYLTISSCELAQGLPEIEAQ